MFDFGFLIVAALGIFFSPLVLSVVALSRVGGTKREIAALRARLARAEEALRTGPRPGTAGARERSDPRPDEAPAPFIGPPAPSPAPPVPSPAPTPRPTVVPSDPRIVRDAARERARTVGAGAQPPSDSQSGPPDPRDPPPPPSSDPTGDALEGLLGGRWAVWVGGAALAFGAVFLARYSLEQGLLSPAARLVIAALFALLLLGAGEAARRRGLSVTGYENADVPAVLTAAGTFGLFATVWIAHGVYGYLGPALGFVLLGAVALGTLVAALLHGPWIAALGLLGGYAVPFLVESDTADPVVLALYVLLVGGAALVLARWRSWFAIAVAAALGLLLYGALLPHVAHPLAAPVAGLYLLTTALMFVAAFFFEIYERDPSVREPVERVPSALLIVLALLTFALPLAAGAGTAAQLVLTLGVALATAFVYSAARAVVLPVALVVAARFAAIDLDLAPVWTELSSGGLARYGPTMVDLPAAALLAGADTPFAVGLAFLLAALAVGAAALAVVRRAASAAALAVGAVVLALLLLVSLWGRVSAFAASGPFFVAALGLVGLFAGLALLALRSAGIALVAASDEEPDSERRARPAAAFAVGAFAALALAVAVVLQDGALTVALAFVVAAIAYVYRARPLPPLSFAGLVVAVVWGARVWANPLIVPPPVSNVPVANGLLFGWGGSAAAFALAAILFTLGNARRRARDPFVPFAQGLALAVGSTAAAVLLVHAWNPQELFTTIDTLPEAGFAVLVTGSVALGLRWARRGGAGGDFLQGARLLLGYAGALLAALLLLVAENPVFSGRATGPFGLLIGYAAPAALFAALAALSRPPYRPVAGTLSGLLVFALVSLGVRLAWHPERPGLLWPVAQGELYAYSVAWLLLAIAAMVAGALAGSRFIRLAGGGLLVAVVVKVFLVDMAGLEGILRALSFIGLGAVLVALGLLYQRLRPAR